jgi:hypothetical protein
LSAALVSSRMSTCADAPVWSMSELAAAIGGMLVLAVVMSIAIVHRASAWYEPASQRDRS